MAIMILAIRVLSPAFVDQRWSTQHDLNKKRYAWGFYYGDRDDVDAYRDELTTI